MTSRRRRRTGIRRGLGRLGRGARNAMELFIDGRRGPLSATPYEVVTRSEVARVRRYGSSEATAGPLLLVPPLMVHSEVYDISPELSAVALLLERGIDVWLVDFGAPERQEGGMRRTLDDHVLAIDEAIDAVRRRTERPVHLAGYSQGGIFCYEVAAYRRSRDLASVITFGAPVDIYRNLPLKVRDDLAGRFLRAAGEAAKRPLEKFDGFSATLTSTGFKLLYPANELKHLARFLGILPDKRALEHVVPKRRFLRGEGFVAWPGPAFRDFFEQVVAENRLSSGGLVINGRAVSLADITCPILYFHGATDNLARSSAVKAIERVTPKAELHGVQIPSGHFGLVVGSKALSRSWPLVVEWIRWREGSGDEPPGLKGAFVDGETSRADRADRKLSRKMQKATELVDDLWNRLGEGAVQAAGIVDALRWELPRLARLERLRDKSPVSFAQALSEQAAAIGDETFFLWKGRAFSYAEVEERVNGAAGALAEAGVRPGDQVALLMDTHPDLLTATAALNRLGAVALVLDPDDDGGRLREVLRMSEVASLVVDGHRSDEMKKGTTNLRVITFGDVIDGANRHPLPEPPTRGPGLARDLALLLPVSRDDGDLALTQVTNGRFYATALSVAASCRLSSRDTLYCCVPVYNVTALLVGVGGALLGGARLALAPRFDEGAFWDDVRRTGSTVIYATDDLCRGLLQADPSEDEAGHPVRLIVGPCGDTFLWSHMVERFGPVEIFTIEPERAPHEGSRSPLY